VIVHSAGGCKISDSMAKTKTQKKKVIKTVTIRGRGDYNISDDNFNEMKSTLARIDRKLPDVRGAVKSAAPKVGAAIGSMFGNPVMGSKLASKAAELFGFGDYSISANTLIPNLRNSSEALVPKFHTSKNSVRIVEREFLGDVVSASVARNFVNNSFPLVPTSSSTFPWLSQIALLYEQWQPNGIVFEFVSTSSEYNGASQALGTVILATDYNPLDPPFPNKPIMENNDYSNSVKSSCSAMHGVECDPRQRPLDIMYCNQSLNSPLQFSSLGNFQLASVGCSTASVTLGELWVSYDITFYKKTIQTAQNQFYGATGTSNNGGSLFGNSPSILAGSTANIYYNVTVGISTNLFLPAGSWLISWYYVTGSGFPTWTLSACTQNSTRSSAGGTTGITLLNVTSAGTAGSCVVYGPPAAGFVYNMFVEPCNPTMIV
jgi:tetrahydromethanopterin S-methyltransferase subunit G